VLLDRELKGGSNGTNFVGFDGVFVFFLSFFKIKKKLGIVQCAFKIIEF
jgi:hypothetical protein